METSKCVICNNDCEQSQQSLDPVCEQCFNDYDAECLAEDINLRRLDIDDYDNVKPKL